MSKIRLLWPGLLLILVVHGCAAPVNRTRQLLELDLAHRQSAIESLTEKQEIDPQPWQAYSLGVLYGADGDYENMNRWFDRCSSETNVNDLDIEYNRLGHWRDEAKLGDEAAKEGNWNEALRRFELALLAAPEKSDTRLRMVEARVMAYGPGLEEIRALVLAESPGAVYRWLEQAAAYDQEDELRSRHDVLVRLTSQLVGAGQEPGDDLAAFVAGELSRLEGNWLAVDEYYRDALKSADNAEQAKTIIAARRQMGSLLLQQSLEQWAADQVPSALAKLDTAEMVDPGRADIFEARRNIVSLERATTGSQVAETLAVGDLDQRWLAFWMSRLYTRGRLRDAGMVSSELLKHRESLTTTQLSQALRVRVAFSRSSNNLDQARDDLRDLLSTGEELPVEAVILGDVLLAQSRYEEALHWFNQAETWGDDSVSLILRKARIAFSQDRFEDMKELANLAVTREPNNGDAQDLLTQSYLLTGQEVAP